MARSIVFDFVQRVQVRFVAPFLRAAGKRVYQFGMKMKGPLGSADRVIPCPNRVAIHGQIPELHNFVFVGANSSLIGDITSGRNSVVYYSCNLKTDGLDSSITIGENTVINDLVTIKAFNGYGLKIGNNCIISSNSILSNCIIENNAVVGLNSIVGEGSEIGEGAFLAAGAVLGPNQKIPSGELWAGSPATYLRKVNVDENEFLTDIRIQHIQLGEICLEEAQKSDRQILLQNSILNTQTEEPENGITNTDDILDQWEEISERFKFPVAEEDFRFAWNRTSEAQFYSRLRYPTSEQNFDGNKNKFPKHLDINKDNFHKKNLIKEDLENNKETQRYKNEYFKEPRQTLNDDSFKRKF